MTSRLTNVSDTELLVEAARLVSCERQATTALIRCLMEVDARRLYLGQGCSSLFTYCTDILRLSEHAAYGRIEAGRAARRFPVILDLLTQGAITLTTVSLLARHLTPENHQTLLQSARHKRKREVETLVAALRPQPDIAPMIRKVPVRITTTPADGRATGAEVMSPLSATSDSKGPSAPGAPSSKPAARPASVSPLALERYKVQFTVSRGTFEKLRRAQDLMRHTIPTGEVAVIFDRAIALLLEHLERRKLAATPRPRDARERSTETRHIPASVRRAVWTRDGGQCAFVGTNGRCIERGFLEYHHVVPYAAGGKAVVDNIILACRAHNRYEAEQYFGTRAVSPHGGSNFVTTLYPP